MRIIVDAFGGDHAPLEILKGCAQAVEAYGIDILLTGDRKRIEQTAGENQISLARMKIVDAPDVISMEDSPGEIMKSKSGCSMAEGLRRLAAGDEDAFISAGNSGALVVGATLLVKRIKGVKRCAFAPIIPSDRGCFMLMDSGANVECRPEQLQQFGVMGSVYMKRVMGVRQPRVGLVNVGTEDHKGGELQHEAFALLKRSPVHFIGNIEARDIPLDVADVVVADGFTGNVILKLYEGVAMMVMRKVKELFTKSAKNKLAASMMMSDIKELKKQMDYNEYGGAPIMGISKPVFKAHGSSQAKTFQNALRLTVSYVQENVVGEISEELSALQGEEQPHGNEGSIKC